MSGLNLTNFASAMKNYYTDKKIQNTIYPRHPWFALIKKEPNWVGQNFVQPVIWGTQNGDSATFSTSITDLDNSRVTAFTVTDVSYYSQFKVSNQVILASGSDAGAFFKAATFETDRALQKHALSLAMQLYRSGTGSMATISSSATVASATIILTNPEDIVNFQVGQTITASATDGGSLRSGSALISKVTRDATSVSITTAGGNWSTQITSLATGDYLYQQGNEAAGSTNLLLTGMLGWLPTTAPSSTLFFGVDRSQDTVRLGGVRYANPGGLNIEEVCVGAVTEVYRNGGVPTLALMNPTQFRNLVNSLGSKCVFGERKVGEVGFKTVQIATDGGFIDAISDPDCPVANGFIIDESTWYLLHRSPKLPNLFDADGKIYQRDFGNSDGITGYSYSYVQSVCTAPGFNAVVTW
jgi:hypothetical protein